MHLLLESVRLFDTSLDTGFCLGRATRRAQGFKLESYW